jgi:hypothetical protein
MMARALALAAACALTGLTAGCGSDGGGGDGGGLNPADKRGAAFECITREKQLEARLAGEKAIQVNGPGGARLEFFVSSGEAEARQFQGEAQGAEQIGAALLFVNRASDADLQSIEDCLSEQ